MTVEIIRYEDEVLAIVANSTEIKDKLSFISPKEFPLQVGVHNKEKDFFIEAHEHIPFDKLENLKSQEIFYIASGKAEVGLYHGGKKVASRIIKEGDLMILNSGHDLKFLEDTKLIEVKQGPYREKENEKRYIK